MKAILAKARKYLKLKSECAECNEAAKKALQSLREAIDEAGLKPIDASGVRRFQCGKHIIEMTPQSDKVKIKDDPGSEAAAGSDDDDMDIET